MQLLPSGVVERGLVRKAGHSQGLPNQLTIIRCINARLHSGSRA